MRHLPRIALVISLAASTLALQACLPIAATGVAVGASAMMDRRTIGAQTEDREIQIRALNRIAAGIKEHGGVGITSYNRRVLLSGQVPDEQTKRAVESIVLPTPGVKMVYNELQVAPRSSLTAEARDAALTTRVKASFVEQSGLNANTVKVVTEDGVVYLMGLVTDREGKLAAGVASRVSGVARVVTLFEYISEESLKRD
jgi:osmotically-inducible protein OsmY